MNVNNLGLNDLGGEVVDVCWTDTDGVTWMGDPEDPGNEPDQWNEYPGSDNELLRVRNVDHEKKKAKKKQKDGVYYGEDEGARRLQAYDAWLAKDDAKKKRKRKQ